MALPAGFEKDGSSCRPSRSTTVVAPQAESEPIQGTFGNRVNFEEESLDTSSAGKVDFQVQIDRPNPDDQPMFTTNSSTATTFRNLRSPAPSSSSQVGHRLSTPSIVGRVLSSSSSAGVGPSITEVMETSCRWAWLGDMELDDVFLGLGAAGAFPGGGPLALGFLVNSAHCLDKPSGERPMRPSRMFREKTEFLNSCFAGSYFSILDQYHSAGRERGWVGDLSGEQLSQIGPLCGLPDELEAWVDRIAASRPLLLNIIISGPLLGRGEEFCRLLKEKVLDTPGESHTFIVFWMYAGSFNLVHSSPQDLRGVMLL